MEAFQRYVCILAFLCFLSSFKAAEHHNRNTLSRRFIPAITSFSPTQITAGTASLLTINGTDFGTTKGAVLFKDADNGGTTYIRANSSEIVSWNNYSIVVKVPQDAGTGQIAVLVNNVQYTSSTSLSIKYAVIAASTNNGIEPIRLINHNSLGGYTFQLETSFDANSAAKASFNRALASWKCKTNINWIVGEKTTVNTVAADDLNVIKFGGNGEIENGTLGYTQSSWKRCASGKWELRDIDMVFNNRDYSWNYSTNSPAPNQFDFETVALHELGHAHSLGHVINPADPMHYAIGYGSVNRNLNTTNIEAGNYIIDYSSNILSGSCNSPLLPLPAGNCSQNPPEISSFSPTSGSTGTMVTINGSNFSNTLGVSFGGVNAQSFVVTSPTSIVAIVGSGASGNITIINSAGTATASGFTYILKLNQTIIGNPLPNKNFGDPDFDPGATASSGLMVSYTSSNPLVCNIVNNRIRIVGVGTSVITASQSGNSTFNPANNLLLTLKVDKANQLISFPQLSVKQVGDPDFDLEATSSSGLALNYSSSNTAVAEIFNGKIKVVAPGTTQITASQAGNSNYNEAKATQILTVIKRNQLINFPPIIEKTFGDLDFDPGATTSSGLALTYSSTNLNVATIINGKIRITGVGVSEILATQEGDANNSPATASRSLLVKKADQNIVFEPVDRKKSTDPEFELRAFASSGLPISYTSSNPNIIQINGNRAKIVGFGLCNITAIQPGDSNFNSAVPVSQQLEVSFSLPTTNFTLKATDETCRSSNNGSVQIIATQNLSYLAKVTGAGKNLSLKFNSDLTINNLEAGKYSVCITVENQSDYQQCFNIEIREPKELNVYTSLSPNRQFVTLTMSGAAQYFVNLNGKIFDTTQESIQLELSKGSNVLNVSTNLFCQGTFSQKINRDDEILIFPNPVKNTLKIKGTQLENEASFGEIFSLDGRKVITFSEKSTRGYIEVDVTKLIPGYYVLSIYVRGVPSRHKFLKLNSN